jgi:hypothetical protein
MSPNELPKPRSDSTLKTLPEERQNEIVEFARDHGLIKTAQWLSRNGVPTSKSAVARFLSWYRSRQTFLRQEAVASTAAAELARECPDLTPDRLQHVGHIFFTSLALQKEDHKSWYMAEQIALKTARLKLDIRKHDDKSRIRRQPPSDHVPAPSFK